MRTKPIQTKPVLASLSDEEVLALSIEKPDVFSAIFERYHEAFRRKAKAILLSEEAAEDAVQEAFVKIYVKAKKFKVVPGASFKSWGYKILINTCFTAYRKMARDRNAAIALDDELEAILREEGGFEERVNLDYFVSLISRMPETFRRVLELGVLGGKTIREIATLERVTVGAIRTRMHRAKRIFEKLRVEIV